MANLISVEKLIPIPCPANEAEASKQFDTISRSYGDKIVFTIYNYLHKSVVNTTDWLYRVTSNMQWYSQSGIGGRLDGKGVFMQDVIGQNPPVGTGTNGNKIDAQMQKVFGFNIVASHKMNADGTITLTTKITSINASKLTTLRYIAYIQDDDLFPNEFRQFITPWSGIILPKSRAGQSRTFKTIVPVAPYMNSTKFKVVCEVADAAANMYEHEIKVATFSTLK